MSSGHVIRYSLLFFKFTFGIINLMNNIKLIKVSQAVIISITLNEMHI